MNFQDFFIFLLIEIITIFIGFVIHLLWKRYKLQPVEKAGPNEKIEIKEVNEVKTEEEDKKEEDPPTIYNTLESQQRIVDFAIKVGGNNIATRHQQKTASELDHFDRTTPLTKKSYKYFKNCARACYGCNCTTKEMHPVYIFSCKNCGNKFQSKRNFTRDLYGHVSLVIGSRTKLGHQVALKLLRSGSIVIGTTRYPEKMTSLFKDYDDYQKWRQNLIVYKDGLDLDSNDLSRKFKGLSDFIMNKFHKLDNLIICAAQTIRVREKSKEQVLASTKQFNRYGDPKFVEEKYVNSWQMTIKDITQTETEECMRINAVAPALLVQALIPVMKKSDNCPYIISVHAREGLFSLEKGPKHIHTNMAKAALHMLTRTLIDDKSLVTETGKSFQIHGCDPGWISVDEYYEKGRPFIFPPLDEIDGAARVLYPLFKQLKSTRMTRRHFDEFAY